MIYIESIKLIDGVFCNLSLHIDRMKHTVGKVFFLDLLVPETYRKGIVKCRILYNEQGVKEVTYQPYTLPNIQTLRIIEDSDIDYSQKKLDRSSIDCLMSQRKNSDDIIITQNGSFTDTSFCNVVFESEDGLYTPKIPLLKGTKRQFLLNLGIIKEREITSQDLNQYIRVYLINAMIDLEDKLCVEIKNIRENK